MRAWLLSIAIVLAHAEASACTPARATVKNVAATIERATEVFLGTITAIDAEANSAVGRVRFRIGEVYKGAPTDQSWYYFQLPNGIMCPGLPPRIGYQAIIFIRRDPVQGRVWAAPQFGLGTNREMLAEALHLLEKKP